MAAPCPLLGAGVTEDTLLHIALFLPTAKDLLRLQLTNKRFSEKCIAAPSVSGGGGAAAAAAPERLSIAEEAARRWVAGCNEQERGWVPRRGLESWLGLMHEVGVLRLPLAFGRAHANVTLTENGAVVRRRPLIHDSMRTAASKVVMRSGRHFAQFTVLAGETFFCGTIRPGWDVEWGNPTNALGHCFYNTADGRRWPGNFVWVGAQAATEQGDRIGVLLDLEQGSMSVWEDDVQLGVMKAEGLRGPLCWAISLAQGASARVESAPTPPSPTEEELAAAKAWQAAIY